MSIDSLSGKTISIDFDGVIHAYRRGWHDGTIYDVPIYWAKEAIKGLRDAGFKIAVHTAREDLFAVRDWLKKYDIEVELVSNRKQPSLVYIDDRGLRFTDWDNTLGQLATIIGKEVLEVE
ncbi:hypothetical protein LCGC14_2255460 [marine sediment metagenome]|uniref:FCP1 homology domain-containing protein n=1 Tax=marine sediment metagenome TaxID=412755 RepID=A0A0F9DNR6_9ZZZZ